LTNRKALASFSSDADRHGCRPWPPGCR
jgi:hypothetical protein